MIKNNVDDTPVATSTVNHYPTPAIPLPTATPMNTDNDFYNWINSTPDSEFPSPEFGHTPLQSFEDDGIEDTPLNDLVTPQLDDLNEDSFDNNGKSSLDNFEGLFTMDESPEALMSYWDYASFGDVSGTGVDSSSVLPNMTLENEAIPLMGPPTNVAFKDIFDEPRHKKRKVQEEQVQQGKVQETMNPADMHVSVSPPAQFVVKQKDARAMPPPNEVPIHLTSSHSGPSSSAPKPRVPTESVTAPIDSSTRQRSQTRKYTGTRAGITPSKLIPMDAPVQARNYILPSSTSRKELPAAFADKVAQSQLASITRGKKRGHSEVEETADDNVEIGGVNLPSNDAASLQQAIETKRLQNTYAARRSRQRKLEYLKSLEDRVKDLESENDGLKNRVEELEAILTQRGGPT